MIRISIRISAVTLNRDTVLMMMVKYLRMVLLRLLLLCVMTMRTAVEAHNAARAALW